MNVRDSTINFFISPCYAEKEDAGPDSRTEAESKNFPNIEKCDWGTVFWILYENFWNYRSKSHHQHQ